jgi:hypothetical protein
MARWRALLLCAALLAAAGAHAAAAAEAAAEPTEGADASALPNFGAMRVKQLQARRSLCHPCARAGRR